MFSIRNSNWNHSEIALFTSKISKQFYLIIPSSDKNAIKGILSW